MGRGTGEQRHSQDLLGSYVLIGYALMTPPEPPSHRLRPDQASGPAPRLDRLNSGSARGSRPAPCADAADRRTARSGLHDSSTRCMSTDVGRTRRRRTVAHSVDEALALIAADGAAIVTYTERFWQTLAARPRDAAPDDSAAAALIEMLFRQGLLQQPISIDDPAAAASWNGLGRRTLLVARIEGSPRQPVRLVWYATPPATLSRYADVAEVFAHRAGLALEAVTERDNLNRAVAGTASGRTGPRNLDGPPAAYGRPGLHSAATPVAEHQHEATNDRSNRHPDRRSAGLPRRLRPIIYDLGLPRDIC